MKLETYNSQTTLEVFKKLGFEIVVENEYVYYLFHQGIRNEIFVDKQRTIEFEVLEKQLCNIKLDTWVFDSLYDAEITRERKEE